MKIKTSELSGVVLDWAVTTIEEPEALRYGVDDWREQRRSGRGEYPHRYHQNWNQGGPIIEREGILFTRTNDGEMYHAWIVRRNASALGPTHLIAAMRCHVASHLGDEADIPEALA